jgi:hypothetical protein
MNPLAFAKQATRALISLAAIASLLLLAGCGSSTNPVPVKGGFSDANLKGTYSFTTKGYGFNVGSNSAANFFAEGGIFTSDGNGKLTAGQEDFVEVAGGTTQAFTDPVTGVYSINRDGTGDLQFNFSGGGSEQYRITLSSSGELYMEEDDGGGTSAGSAYLQTSTSMPSGTFVFRTHDVQVSATMGRMTVSAGTVSGEYEMVQNGVRVTGSVSGSMSAPTGGRGSMTYSVNGLTHQAQYYVVSASKFLLLDTTPNILSIGLAELQNNVAFSAASLSGSYAFGSSGETPTPGFVNTVGAFTADGVSGVSATFDSVQDGALSTNQTAAGNYVVDNAFGNGSGAFTVGGLTRDIWMVAPSRAYFIALNGTNVEDGAIDQQSSSFTNSSFNAQGAFFMDGFNWNQIAFGNFTDVALEDRVGTLVPDGSGAAGTNYLASFFAPNLLVGAANPVAFTGTYSVASNGRTTVQLGSGNALNIVLYLTSNHAGYLLDADSGINMSGTYAAQVQPQQGP